MSRCPNCSYKLVFLSTRRKYKCAKCGSLFLQKLVESKTFRTWNTKQRETDKHNLVLEVKQQKILRNMLRPKKPKSTLSEEERKQRRRESSRKWRLQNPEKNREQCRTYYGAHRDKILAKKKNYN